jgi:elongator complex protein 3
VYKRQTEQLVNLIADIKPTIPRYCRVNRVIRDIPSTLVVEGNRRTSLRQDIQQEMSRRGTSCQCIRCREIRKRSVSVENLSFNDFVYHTEFSEEHFLSFDTIKDKLAGFLRLSLPGTSSPDTGIHELGNAAIIREVHVYGQSLSVGADQAGAAQHIGLGTELISRAEAIAQRKGYSKLAIISAIGTRQYYANRGFDKGDLYMVKKLS